MVPPSRIERETSRATIWMKLLCLMGLVWADCKNFLPRLSWEIRSGLEEDLQQVCLGHDSPSKTMVGAHARMRIIAASATLAARG